MSQISSSSLFHFTRQKETLFKILEKGLRFSFCRESLPGVTISANSISTFDAIRRVYKLIYFGIPMLCFCDIPLGSVAKHVEKYGRYGVAFDKGRLPQLYNCKGGYEMNPVCYFYGDKYTSPFYDLCSVVGSLENEKSNKANLVRILGFSKPFDNRREQEEAKGVSEQCFYDEREWRIVLSESEERNIHWPKSFRKDEIDGMISAQNEKLYNSNDAYLPILKFSDEDIKTCLLKTITHIIVDKETDIPEVADFILGSNNTIFGIPQLTQQERTVLCTRLISLERINTDY